MTGIVDWLELPLVAALARHSDGSCVQLPASAWLWRAQAGECA